MRDGPYFSIGVTTFNRKEMLAECIKSILGQTFADFEVLIGNDYTLEKLSLEDLGIADPRVKIINHPENLGEIENMKYLLTHSNGEYFTWLADDDAYHPHFLRVAHDVFRLDRAVDCVFTSYWSGDVRATIPYVDPAMLVVAELRLEEFLEQYLTRRIAVIGCYGMFKSSFLRKLGGMRRAGSGLGPYSDNLLGIKAAALGRVVHVDQPLIFYRIHPGSLSCSSASIEAYTSAQSDVVQEFDLLIRERVCPEEYSRLKLHLFEWFVGDLAAVWGRSRQHLSPFKIWDFVRLVGASYLSNLPFKHKPRLAMTITRLVFILVRKSVHGYVVSHAQ
ncbi:MAG: GalNAc(5)-diNAcBac-PP-undecaprenol beta-1,3-glucosyltransferase [Nitrosomonadaceae bacterium]|nr:GalNAc(5)-diNAcBac-PP-undecaprenol beta-1,3-glucosyltransferase [Nitrosomonadaceae bacterium]